MTIEVPFRALLGLSLPDPRMTALLRACLLSGGEGRQAWASAAGPIEGLSVALKHDMRDARNLVPLLAAAQVRNGVEADPGVRTLLRTGLVREELRAEVFRGLIRSVVGSCRAHSEPFAVVGGSAAMETLYGSFGLRHTHGIDVLTTRGGLRAAANRLTSDGFRPERSSDPRTAILRHDTGVPVRLMTAPSRWLSDDWEATPFLNRAIERPVAGERVPVLSVADTMLEICARAFDPEERDGSLWACDAFLLVREHRDLDWNAVLAVARKTRLSDFVCVALDYLARELAVSVPDHVMASLRASPGPPAAVGRDVVLTRLHATVGWRRMAGQVGNGWRRLALAGRLALPSAAYMRRTRRVSHGALLPWHYGVRLVRFALRSLGPRPSHQAFGR